MGGDNLPAFPSSRGTTFPGSRPSSLVEAGGRQPEQSCPRLSLVTGPLTQTLLPPAWTTPGPAHASPVRLLSAPEPLLPAQTPPQPTCLLTRLFPLLSDAPGLHARLTPEAGPTGLGWGERGLCAPAFQPTQGGFPLQRSVSWHGQCPPATHQLHTFKPYPRFLQRQGLGNGSLQVSLAEMRSSEWPSSNRPRVLTERGIRHTNVG